MTHHVPLFEPVTFGEIEAPNRIFMAPLTRARSTADENAQTELHQTYYAQRASAGLIVSEATQISQEGQGYAWTPGIFSDAHVDGWKGVTDAVHSVGGRMFVQLWHVGAISHPVFHGGEKPVSASAWTPEGEAFVGDLLDDGPMVPHVEARALETDEISRLLEDFRHATRMARKAGFDGAEVHGANGYLLDQFLRSSVNKRTDRYGGSVKNRIRLLVETVDAVVGEWEPGRVGVRLSPVGGAGGSYDDDPETLYTEAARALSGKGLAYLHVVRPNSHTAEKEGGKADLLAKMKDAFGGPYIANGGFEPEDAAKWIEEGRADAITFGRKFLANPDLPKRIAQDGPYNEPDPDTFYGGGEEGYIDYPTLDDDTGKAAIAAE